jgi:hypothetical protein
MHRRFVGVAAVRLPAPALGLALALALAAGAALPAPPAQAASSRLVVKVTPSQGLRPGQTVVVSGRGLARSSGGTALTWFVTECTAAVQGRMNPATDTPHCDIAHAEAIRLGRDGTFSTHYRLTTGIIGDGYCGTEGHATCVIGVGTAQGQGTVVRITFRTPPAPAGTGTTTTTTTSG